MNFYPRYCGDYARDTAHLALAEHGVYGVLLDVQYSTERGLPAPYADLCRICRAMDRAEQDAVRRVADEFFPIGADGLRWNPRAARELAKVAPRVVAARQNGSKGGRPKGAPPDVPIVGQEKPTGFSVGSQNETQQEPNRNPTNNPPGFSQEPSGFLRARVSQNHKPQGGAVLNPDIARPREQPPPPFENKGLKRKPPNAIDLAIAATEARNVHAEPAARTPIDTTAERVDCPAPKALPVDLR